MPSINADRSIDPAGIFGAISFDGLKTVIAAVSGGSDSLALLCLLEEMRRDNPSFPNVIAVTVDHQLRPESADEAAFVAELCAAAGLKHRILSWTGPKPTAGISARARDVRYELLRQAAREAGTDMILTGHTLDDQNETFMMRSARGGERGLAGMASVALLEREIWLVRPLLAMRREHLRQYLRSKNVTWREDPSNTNPKYERVRVRHGLQTQNRDDIQALIVAKAIKRRMVNQEAAQLLQSQVRVLDGIRAEINPHGFSTYSQDAQNLAVGVLLAILGGQAFLPSVDDCAKALIHICEQDGAGRMNLSRCIVQRTKSAAVIYREMRSLPEMMVEAGERIIWDGRYRIQNQSKNPILISACGDEGVALLKSMGSENIHRASIKSSPALWSKGMNTALPAAGDHAKVPADIQVTRHVALFDHILSGYDELLAASVAKLFGLQGYKRFPVNQIHKN